MSLQADLFNDLGSKPASLLVRLLDSADTVLVKKLSNNDRDWARFSNKHQAGVYMPPAQRDGGFFPPLVEKLRDKGDPIREVYFRTVWPPSRSRGMIPASSITPARRRDAYDAAPKGSLPGSRPCLLPVMARRGEDAQPFYECLTISSTSDDALLLADLLDMQPDFRIEVFNPKLRRKAEQERILDFAEQVIAAWLAGQISTFASTNAVMPATAALAEQARNAWLAREG